MSIAVINPHYMFGATVASCKNAIEFVNNETVVYPAGASIVFYNMEQRSQNLVIDSDHPKPLTALAITPNRRFLAVAEQAAHADSEYDDFQPTITVYDVQVNVEYTEQWASLQYREALSNGNVIFSHCGYLY